MKEKNKKILKGLGIGALACVGMVGLTGCSKVEVSQEKVDSMIETVEKVDGRLDDYIDLLEQQNQQLQDQNAMLEEQNKLLEQANKLTKEDVWNLAQTADYNLMMNVGGVRDNLKIAMQEVTNDYTIEGFYMYYNTDSVQSKVSKEDGLHVSYQKEEDKVVKGRISLSDNDEYICDSIYESTSAKTLEEYIHVYSGTLPGINSFELTYEDLSHYEILENGNVKLTFVKYDTYQQAGNEYVETLETCSFEYTLDAKLVSIEESSKIIYESSGLDEIDGEIEYTRSYNLSYGTVDVDLVESLVELAEAKRNEQ